MPTFLVAVIASYLVGSIPIGFLVARARGIDLRSVGSGNVGATNCGRVLGRNVGLGVFAGDFLKGLIPVLAAGVIRARSELSWTKDGIALALGLAAIVGHVFPVWLGFKGGKGVATSAGVSLGLHWPTVLASIAIWFIVVRLSRYVSLASMVAAIAAPIVFTAIVGSDVALGERRAVTAFFAVIALAILILHRHNIGRLARGEEHRVGSTPSGEKS